jgi:excisionase family DNA binding protein
MKVTPFSARGESLITVGELSDRLHVVKPTLYQLARQGKIPSVRIGGRVRFDWKAVQQYFRLEEDSTMANAARSTMAFKANRAYSDPTHSNQRSIRPTKYFVSPVKQFTSFAALTVSEMKPSQTEAALQICGALGLMPLVVNRDDFSSSVNPPEPVQLVFITPEQLLNQEDFSNRSTLLKIAHDLERVIMVLLVENDSSLKCLEELPSGLPVIICRTPASDVSTKDSLTSEPVPEALLKYIRTRLSSATQIHSRAPSLRDRARCEIPQRTASAFIRDQASQVF